MKIYLNAIVKEDGNEIMEIFNYYAENTFAAYAETRLPPEFFEVLLMMTAGYPSPYREK